MHISSYAWSDEHITTMICSYVELCCLSVGYGDSKDCTVVCVHASYESLRENQYPKKSRKSIV